MNAIVRINDQNPEYTSMTCGTKEEKASFYNAVENPKYKLSEFINKKLTIVHVAMEAITLVERDEDGEPTGVVKDAVKIVFINEKGEGIISTSSGVLRCLYSLFKIFGTPDTWDEPITVTVRQLEIGKNRTFKLEVC